MTTAGRLLPVLEANDDFVPCAVVTPEGRWRDEMAYDGSHWNFKAAADWSAEVRALLVQAGLDAIVTVVDYHC